jgi:primosomal protein N' (replication factor Y)
VAVALPLDRTLTYRLPPVGRRSPGGQPGAGAGGPAPGDRLSLGPGRPPADVKIKDSGGPGSSARFGPELVPLFRWLADYYQYPLGEALSQIIPGGAHLTGPRHEILAVPQELTDSSPARRPGPRARLILDYLGQHGATPVNELERFFPGAVRS